jgi:hypothetical protein
MPKHDSLCQACLTLVYSSLLGNQLMIATGRSHREQNVEERNFFIAGNIPFFSFYDKQSLTMIHEADTRYILDVW